MEKERRKLLLRNEESVSIIRKGQRNPFKLTYPQPPKRIHSARGREGWTVKWGIGGSVWVGGGD